VAFRHATTSKAHDMPPILVWDIETIPDISGFAAANDLMGKTAEEVRVAMGDKFPKHIYRSIICIGALIAHHDGDHWVVDALGTPHVGERSEEGLIASFVDRIAELTPQLVTFNGSSFDLPVLRYRAMVHKVPAVGLSARPYAGPDCGHHSARDDRANARHTHQPLASSVLPGQDRNLIG